MVKADFDAPDWTKICDRDECQRFPNRCDHVPVQHPFVVVTWRHANAGGESLVYHYTAGEPFAIVTGPTPWGAGSWGCFPADCVLDVRELRLDDSWPVNGCPLQRWTPRDLLLSLRQARTGFDDTNIHLLEQAIRRAEDVAAFLGVEQAVR